MFKLIQSLMILSLTTFLFGFINRDNSHVVQAAEVFKWTDADGVEHYSDKPFEEARRVKVSLTGGKPPKAMPQAEPKKVTSTAMFDANDTQRAAEECEKARKNLEAIIGSDRVLQKDADGNDVEMDDFEKATQLAENRSYVETYCQN